MEGPERFRVGRVNIAKCEHVFESIFAPVVVAAASLERPGVPEGSEEEIPHRNVGEIVGVMSVLMMNAMGFRTLKNKS
ncbi:MAG: hypothetical protein JWO45_1049 [Spartobacteria bacterium]|nr:hypothetical protein [Spartobacteria bacterium]